MEKENAWRKLNSTFGKWGDKSKIKKISNIICILKVDINNKYYKKGKIQNI